ncbi:DNA cytosine methyltransferase [Curtobacterium sp. MCBA15_008]|uniref:DNA cytosine methyltransferase n=1 Tax=Curtobacterium sp. MCBA15_008 TaxID=1898736 RepID=UPI000AFC4412
MLMSTARTVTDGYADIEAVPERIGTFVSLYAGAGGLDTGFALAGFTPTWVSELDPFAMDSHRDALKRLADSRPHLQGITYEEHVGDLLNLPDEQLPAEGSADLVIGGPPCQGFSVAGKMNPNDERSKHVFHFLDIVERVQPKAFLLENVKALYSNRRWAAIRDALIARAEDMGYNTLLTLANASHFGVPQARERMFLIGVRRDVGTPEAPAPTTQDAPPTVRHALATLPPYGAPGNDSKCAAKITLAKAPVLRRSPYAGMLFNGAGRPLNLDAPAGTLAASMGGNKTPIIDQNVVTNHEGRSWVVDYHDSLWSNGLGPAASEPPSHLRRLTVEEAAAIQTFPVGMKWHGSRSAQYKQIGNAVPPRLAYAAALAMIRSIGHN